MGQVRDLLELRRSPIRPFHDDKNLQNLVTKIVNEFGIRTFFETGTFKGDTLSWVAKRFPDLDCISVENNKGYFAYACMRMFLRWNIDVILSDSRKALKSEIARLKSPVLFWLDAHWSEDWPLLDELKTIRQSKIPCAIIVDDFQVPNRSLGFDTYQGSVLSYAYMSKEIEDLPVFVPNYDGKGLRGYAVMFQGLRPVESETLSPWGKEQP